jgi:hypothetical protein
MIYDRLTEYCLHGGLYNPELMQHDKVRDLLIDCRDEIARLRLTDEEREAVREAVGAYNDNDDDEECAKIAATLWGLLERIDRRS